MAVFRTKESAMSAVTPEFPRQVAVDQLHAQPFRQRIEATANEREALSRRFDLLSLDHLSAEVVLRRRSSESILLEAEFSAEFEQCCAVSLEPVRGTVSDHFSLVYGPAAENEPEIVFGDDEPAFEPLNGNWIDIGEAVAQELSLALPLFPRHPEAMIDDAAAAKPLERPLAALSRLRKAAEC
ncbi:MAG: DUF177 domain-containing protein [Alphaproteobacteria bacterium]|nr:DUF177 domain-containing protein [Alphaproteobacteria bacterium]